MFFLELTFADVFSAALFGTLITLLLLAALLLVLHFCGIHVFWHKKRRARRVKAALASKAAETKPQNELPEEVLLVILTAAAFEALGPESAKRFRVVAFKRI